MYGITPEQEKDAINSMIEAQEEESRKLPYCRYCHKIMSREWDSYMPEWYECDCGNTDYITH